MELVGVLEIHVQDVPKVVVVVPVLNAVFGQHLLRPSEFSRGKLLGHRQTVEVVGIKVCYVRRGFLFVVVFSHVFVIGDCLLMTDLTHASSQTLFYELVHFLVGYGVNDMLCFEKHGIPSEVGKGQVMSGIQLVIFQTQISEVFEDISEKKNIGSRNVSKP